MKHLIFACLLALISCSKSDDPQPVPKYDTIVGEWTFTGTNVSGQVTIAEFFDNLVVDNIGTFTINGVQYPITRKEQINIGTTPGTLKSFFLVHDDNTYFGFHTVDINSTFTEMTADQYSYGTPGVFVIGDSKIVLKRK